MQKIGTKKQLKEFINFEKKLYNMKKVSVIGPVFTEKQYIWRFVCLLRYQEYFENTHHRILAFLFKAKRFQIGRKCGFSIPINCIDKGLLIFHIGSILINVESIGKNFACNANVALIAGGHDGKRPVVGDNVVLGYGSTICGDVFLANGIAVGACSFVNKSFLEPNICIAGIPAKKISNNGSSTWGGCSIFKSP